MDPAKSASTGLRIGVDVGGTNTDGVIIDPAQLQSDNRGIIAWHKAATTPDPSHGIGEAMKAMFASADIHAPAVASVTIGTTHFVNAVVERDASRLSRVAVLRLCGPFSQFAPPCVDWPVDMRELILGHHALLQGGLEVDGSLISDISESEIISQCQIIKEKGLDTVVVNGVFSPIDTVEKQEERAADIIRKTIPGCDVVCSKDIANIGFLERENAAILNASILKFAKHTIKAFQKPVKELGMKCPVFITQNDGTVLSGSEAARLPIRTFSSGPANSMRGAAFLSQGQLSEAAMVVDIGGTTADVGLLQTDGFPRQQAAYSELAGIRMNFACPDIKSIGLGGGSIVRQDGTVSVGPDSVGYNLTKSAIAFGGDTLTATDCTLLLNPELEIGDRDLVKSSITASGLEKFQAVVKEKLETVIDKMKTSPKDIPVFLVGGGAIIAPEALNGASKVIKPRWAGVANAIGAAMARVSAVIDVVKSTESKSAAEWLEALGKDAIQKTISTGAAAETTEVVEMESLPLQYIDHKTRFIVRAVGDFDFSRSANSITEDGADTTDDVAYVGRPRETSLKQAAAAAPDVEIAAYKPDVRGRVWYISETDVEWISIGCYILGTGGGGSPYPSLLRLRQDLRNGAVIKVVNPKDLNNDDSIGGGGGVGSPTVAVEKLAGNELMEAQEELAKVCNVKITHVTSVEIGGGNGMQSMVLGSSTKLNLPVVDGDWMGRAYPTQWQTTPVVFNERSPVWSPSAMSDGNGNVVVMPRAKSDFMTEKVMRAALAEMGSHTATAEAPITGAETKRWIVEHTLSQAWRIGRSVVKARQENRVDRVADIIIDECGGPSAGQVLFKGKIVGVERRLRGGYAYGECIIEGADVRVDGGGESGATSSFQGRIKIPFKNENIAVLKMHDGVKEERQEDVLAIVPDLITIIDAQNGEAIGTPEYRYGLLVVVLGLAANDKWTKTERGIQLGGPPGFGFDHLKYQPLGSFTEPKSVIDEFNA